MFFHDLTAGVFGVMIYGIVRVTLMLHDNSHGYG